MEKYTPATREEIKSKLKQIALKTGRGPNSGRVLTNIGNEFGVEQGIYSTRMSVEEIIDATYLHQDTTSSLRTELIRETAWYESLREAA